MRGKTFNRKFRKIKMIELLWTITSVAFFVILGYSINQLSETY